MSASQPLDFLLTWHKKTKTRLIDIIYDELDYFETYNYGIKHEDMLNYMNEVLS